MTPSTVPDWADIPQYAASLEQHLGSGAVPRLADAVDASMPAFNRDAEAFYRAFMRAALSARVV